MQIIKNSVSILLGVGLLLAAGAASAQTSTTGAVRGTVQDKASGEALAGATVVATSPALQGTQSAITSGDGVYRISNLPPGMYTITVYYLDAEFSRKNVLVQLGKTAKVNISINSQVGEGEVVEIEGRAPIIDQDSTKTGTTITNDYTENVPTGRTFGSVLGATAGSQGDLYGVSFGGSTSVENQYIVDGVNTTDPGFGLLTTNLPNEFVRETEIITGGYKAEYGRSTGGIVNVITKQGSNEFHGSVFGYWTPGAFVAGQKEVPVAGTAIERQDNLTNSFDFGAEVGGPIIKDRLWFHAGINPSFNYSDTARIIRSQLDENMDGVPDTDENGFVVFGDELDRTTLEENQKTYYYTAKISGAVSPEHQGSLSVLGSPGTRRRITSVTGTQQATMFNIDRNILDTSAKWTSKFNDNKSQVDAVIGYHYDKNDQSPLFDEGLGNQMRYEPRRSLAEFEMFEPGGVPGACQDGTAENPGDDPYPLITNCPVPFYRVGGVGFLEDTTSTRLAGSLNFTQRVEAAGHHTFKVGADVEEQTFTDDRQYTGGAWYRQRASTAWTIRRLYTPRNCDPATDPDCVPCGSDIDNDGAADATCSFVSQLDVDTRTRNIGAFAQDDWAILPNLVVNAGVRWEQQQLFAADDVAGELSPLTGEPIPSEAFTLSNMIAPRLGAIYDPTQEGRSRVYGHWGRFYESIPMDINSRAYGGEILNINVLAPNACDTQPGMAVGSCDEQGGLLQTIFAGSGEELATPGLKAQYLDEFVLGADYEVLPDLKVGAAYIRRDLGRVIEDVSTDGAATYIVANPGSVDRGAIADLRQEAEDLRSGVDCSGMNAPEACGRADFLDFKADQFEGVALFDKPKRTYNALQLTADKRFSRNIFAQVSYTYSRLEGNYPGLFSPETGQLDPNLTSMFDLPELMANRFGPLAADRPHLIKLDGYYTLNAEEIGLFTFGARARASSGIPHNVLGGHSLYGLGESYILPRGSAARSPFTTRFDAKVAYGYRFSDGMMLQAFVDLFNVFNQQNEIDVDELYTFDDVNPIVGGDFDDLEHAKAIGGSGLSTRKIVEKNPNFGNVNARQAPLSARLGMRLMF